MRRFVILLGTIILSGTSLVAQEPGAAIIGHVRDVAGQRPIANARIIVRRSAEDSAIELRSDPTGLFRASGLAVGRYSITVRAPGYRPYDSTISVTQPGGDSLVVLLTAQAFCLGECPADSVRMSAARARRTAWTCTSDSTEIASQHAWWVDALTAPQMRQHLGLTSSVDSLGQATRLVQDRSICRRVGAAFERLGRLVDTTSTVFRLGEYFLTSQPGEHNVILSRRFRVVYYFLWE